MTEDASLYQAKDNGKDQVRVQLETMAPESSDNMTGKPDRRLYDTEAISSPPTSSATVNGSHSGKSAGLNGEQPPSSSSKKSISDSSELEDSQVDNSGDGIAGERWGPRRRVLPTPLDLRDTVANGLGLLLSPSNIKLSQIPEETSKRRNSQLDSPAMQGLGKEKVMKLSPAQIQELTSSPKSLPIHTASGKLEAGPLPLEAQSTVPRDRFSIRSLPEINGDNRGPEQSHNRKRSGSAIVSPSISKIADLQDLPHLLPAAKVSSSSAVSPRPGFPSRTVSTPPIMRRKHSMNKQNGTAAGPTPQSKSARTTTPAPLQLDDSKSTLKPSVVPEPMPSPMPLSIPMPPLSIPTYLQLELSSDRPSPLYIHRSATSDFPYESSRVKIERLQNFLILPPQLEQVLWFGALACLDAWLYSFTILPLRFVKAVYILSQSWGRNLILELRFVSRIIFAGTGRMWRRRRGQEGVEATAPGSGTEESRTRKPSVSGAALPAPRFSFPARAENPSASHSHPEPERLHRRMPAAKHRRTKSTPSALMPDHKADILKGLLVIFSCTILMYFDASRMYHSIRGQAAIKLYVIYNVLEVTTLIILVDSNAD